MPVLTSQWHSMGYQVRQSWTLYTCRHYIVYEDLTHSLGALEAVCGKSPKTVWASDGIVCTTQTRGFRAQ